MNPVLLFPLPFLLYFGWLLYAMRDSQWELPRDVKYKPTSTAPTVEILPPWSEQDRIAEAVLYAATNAPWLDPDRYGERPGWRHDLLPRHTVREWAEQNRRIPDDWVTGNYGPSIDPEKDREAAAVNYALGLSSRFDDCEVKWVPGFSVFSPSSPCTITNASFDNTTGSIDDYDAPDD